MEKWRKQAFVAAWIAVQIALPLRYYLVAWSEDPVNEMYAWRMFSDTFYGASMVEWFWFDGDGDAGVPLERDDLVKEAGLSRRWATVATGKFRHHSRAPDLDTMRRIGEHLCAALKGRPKFANLTAIGAVRSGAEWDGDDVWEQEFVWDC